METDVLALIDKLKRAVEYRTKVELATALCFTETAASTLVGADARVESASALLMAVVKSAARKGTT